MKLVEKLKVELLNDLHLMRPLDWEAYWRQAKWPKPNLVELGRNQVVIHRQRRGDDVQVFAPIRYALGRLEPDLIASASEQLDPFGWLLDKVELTQWNEFCRTRRVPWMTRVCLAAASQLRAEIRLIFKAHGWSDTWEKLRRNPNDLRAALDFFTAQLNHARGQRRVQLLAIRPVGLSEASLRRLRRARTAQGKRAGVSPAEKFIVQHWLELPHGYPGLCFFSDTALHSLLVAFGLTCIDDAATKQARVRLGLIQAGVRNHLIEDIVDVGGSLTLLGKKLRRSYQIQGRISWANRRLWPRR